MSEKNSTQEIIFFGGLGSQSQFGGELTKNKEIVRRLKELGYNVTILDSFNCSHDKIKLFKLICNFIWQYIKKSNSTFIFSTFFGNIYPLLRLVKCFPLSKRHIIYWVIGGNMSERMKRGMYKEGILRMIDLYIVEGQKMRSEMISLGYNEVITLPNFKRNGKIIKTEKFSDGKVHFLFLSRIMPEKGVRYILEAVQKLNDKGFEKRFVVDFYGSIDPSYKLEFEDKIKDFPNVRYAGLINLQEEANYNVISKYHFMLFPTYWYGEGFPGVVIDAYKASIPIIASDWNFNKEFVIEGETGFIVETHSLPSLINTIEHTLSLEPNKYEKMVDNCQKMLKCYNTDNCITKELMHKIIST